MSVLLVVNTAPYGSEGPYNALRLAEALALRDEHVEVFLMGDAVHAARAGQDPRGAHASLEQMLLGLLEQGVDVLVLRHLLHDPRPRGGRSRPGVRVADHPRPRRRDGAQRQGRLLLTGRRGAPSMRRASASSGAWRPSCEREASCGPASARC